jgi:hypothetical protein
MNNNGPPAAALRRYREEDGATRRRNRKVAYTTSDTESADNQSSQIEDTGPQAMDPIDNAANNTSSAAYANMVVIQNSLDQDYDQCSLSVQPTRQAITNQTATQHNMGTPATPQPRRTALATMRPTIQINSDHDLAMIDSLKRHIWDTLSSIPYYLPEIKGLRVNLPDAYEGDDNFDRLDNWLQGLLRYFKLQRLTVADRDVDRILVTGMCLKGGAE